MSRFEGGCHCGKVRFRVNLTPQYLVDCDCTVCVKKGIKHLPARDEEFELLSGANDLSLYQWRTNTASHWFCKHCGIHTHGRPRSAPTRYTVNACTLDDFEALQSSLPMRHFDGKNHPKDRV